MDIGGYEVLRVGGERISQILPKYFHGQKQYKSFQSQRKSTAPFVSRSSVCHSPRPRLVPALSDHGVLLSTSYQIPTVNMYGFKMLGTGDHKGAYTHELLERGNTSLCRVMVRAQS
jgi:hypothetical protein